MDSSGTQRIEPDDSEMLSEMTRELGWDILYDQVDPGRFGGCIEFAASNRTQFFRERYHRAVCVHGAVPQGMATFIVAAGPADGMSFSGGPVTAQTICALMAGDEGALCAPAGGGFLTCCLEAVCLDDSLQALHHTTLDRVLPRTGPLHGTADHATGLRLAIHGAFPALRNPGPAPVHGAEDPAGEQQALAAICHALTIHQPAPKPSLAARNHWRCVRAAREFIENHLAEALTMEMLCRHTGASERTLETAFREVTGCSPQQFIRVRRLNVARHKLLTDRTRELSVKEAALTSGFRHLGRFSRDYFSQFGELPTATGAGRARGIARDAPPTPASSRNEG